jgi:hypothetical protein
MIFFSNLSPGGLPRTSPSSSHLELAPIGE